MASSGFLTQGGGLLKILYLGTRNTIEAVDDAAFTKVNHAGNAQLAANATTADVPKLGCLAGSVASITGEGVVGAGSSATGAIVGLFVNDLAGNAFESSSAAASEKGVFVCGMGTYEVGVYETADTAGSSIMSSYAAGAYLYCSQNGFLTVKQGLAGGTVPTGAVVIGLITKAPTPSDALMRFQLRL